MGVAHPRKEATMKWLETCRGFTHDPSTGVLREDTLATKRGVPREPRLTGEERERPTRPDGAVIITHNGAQVYIWVSEEEAVR